MARTNNLNNFLTDIATAIKEKKGDNSLILASEFDTEIANLQTGRTGFTGHVDAEGLAEIGWDEDDIAYYQQFVGWNTEDDEYHLVNEYSKALYEDYQNGIYILPTSFGSSELISAEYPNINYSPKFDTNNVTNMSSMFQNCSSLVAIPLLDTNNVTNMSSMFQNCNSLVAIPLLDTSNVTNMQNTFYSCYSLKFIPELNTSNVTNMTKVFRGCCCLTSIPEIDISNVTALSYAFQNCYSLVFVPELDTSNVTTFSATFQNCYSLTTVPLLDTPSTSSYANIFAYCYSLSKVKLSNLKNVIDLSASSILTHESLLYLFNNAQIVSDKTITLGDFLLAKLTDEEKEIATNKGWTLV